MINGFFIKHPDATRQYTFDFAPDVPEDDSIIDYTLTVKNSAGDDVLATDEVSVVVGVNSDGTIDATFTGGIDGENYRVTMLAILDTSTTNPTKIIEMRVRSKDV